MTNYNNPEIKVEKRFDSARIREECIKNDWYTWGDCEEYNDMLTFARRSEYSAANLYKIARDIFEHSEKEHLPEGNDGIECIMFVVERFATFTTFEIA